jgi:hypothetical protein
MRRHKYTLEEVKTECIKRKGKCLSENYKNNKTAMIFKCDVCNHQWTTNFKAILIQNQWCPKCSGRLNNNIEVAKNIAIERNGVCLSNQYKNNKENLLWKCNVCNHEWYARLDRVKSGTWCPKCRLSWGEKKIIKYLDSKNILYKNEYVLKDCKNYRLDFYLPCFNLGIEYDGIQHFKIHRRYSPDIETLLKTQNRDIIKTKHCIEHNIRLLRISYNDYKNIPKLIDIYINNINKLGLSNNIDYSYILKNINTTVTGG